MSCQMEESDTLDTVAMRLCSKKGKDQVACDGVESGGKFRERRERHPRHASRRTGLGFIEVAQAVADDADERGWPLSGGSPRAAGRGGSAE